MKSGGSRKRPGGPKNNRDTASNIDNQSNSASTTKQKIESNIFPDQTRDVGVFLYCFKPPKPRAAAAPPPRRAMSWDACRGEYRWRRSNLSLPFDPTYERKHLEVLLGL